MPSLDPGGKLFVLYLLDRLLGRAVMNRELSASEGLPYRERTSRTSQKIQPTNRRFLFWRVGKSNFSKIDSFYQCAKKTVRICGFFKKCCRGECQS
jgi:hypothetical protein